MSYQVIIRKTVETRKRETPEWQTIGQQPLSDEDVKQMRRYREQGEELPAFKELRGYPPEREVVKIETADVFNQTVEELDMKAVIMAVNGMEGVS